MCKNFIKYTALICNYLYHFKITSDTLYLVKVCWLTVVTYVICSRNCDALLHHLILSLLCCLMFLSLDHMIAIVLPRQEQWWVFLYEPIHIYPKLSTACSVSLYMLMYFPCICRHVHCQCIIICYDIYVSLKWKVHFCYHLQKQCQKQIQLKLLLSIYC